MKRLAVLFLLCAFTAASGRADDSLVSASRDAKSKRKKSTTKVLTNADVKKSKGTLIDSKAAQTPVPEPGPGLVEQYEAAKQTRALTDAKIAAFEKEIAALEKELAAIEQSYYEENDLQRRDIDIVKRFNDTKKKLDDTRAQLETLQGGPKPDAQPGESKSPER